MDVLWRAINLLGILFTVAMTVVMLFTYRAPRRIAVFPLLISMSLSLIALPVFVWLSGARLNLWISVPIFLLGLIIGAIRGLTTRLSYEGGQVVGRRSWLFLLGWGASLVVAQALAMAGSALLASAGLIPLYLTTGSEVGIQSNLLLRRLLWRPGAAGSAHPA